MQTFIHKDVRWIVIFNSENWKQILKIRGIISILAYIYIIKYYKDIKYHDFEGLLFTWENAYGLKWDEGRIQN